MGTTMIMPISNLALPAGKPQSSCSFRTLLLRLYCVPGPAPSSGECVNETDGTSALMELIISANHFRQAWSHLSALLVSVQINPFTLLLGSLITSLPHIWPDLSLSSSFRFRDLLWHTLLIERGTCAGPSGFPPPHSYSSSSCNCVFLVTKSSPHDLALDPLWRRQKHRSLCHTSFESSVSGWATPVIDHFVPVWEEAIFSPL